MASLSPHTVKAFDDDLEQIRALVAEMGGLTEHAIRGALTALFEKDNEAAAMTVANDGKIDKLAQEVERNCTRVIAIRAPLADDLRETLAAFKVSVLLERMGDCARNIAEQVPMLQPGGSQPQLRIVRVMLSAVTQMVEAALNAFVRRDPTLCLAVCESDREVDDLHARLFRELLHEMSLNSERAGPCTYLLLASVKLERIGDHAANIARAVFHSATGEYLRSPDLSPSGQIL